jgi:hypothetical protein
MHPVFVAPLPPGVGRAVFDSSDELYLRPNAGGGEAGRERGFAGDRKIA